MIADVKIGDKWLQGDLGYYFNEKNISEPEPNIIQLEIPGTSDIVDLTESVSGDIEYKQRTITIILESVHGKNSVFAKFSDLANRYHGRKLNLIFSKDSGYYWEGRISVSEAVSKFYGSVITITALVDPYKYETQSSLEPWLWDTFSFNDGIIRNYYDIQVPGTITIVGRRKRVCPKIICSEAMNVSYLGNIYPLVAGENTIADIFIGEGEHTLTFIGYGTVSVDYRGGSL